MRQEWRVLQAEAAPLALAVSLPSWHGAQATAVPVTQEPHVLSIGHERRAVRPSAKALLPTMPARPHSTTSPTPATASGPCAATRRGVQALGAIAELQQNDLADQQARAAEHRLLPLLAGHHGHQQH